MNKGNFIIKALRDDINILTKNKIYEFIDGYAVFDNGNKSSYYKDFNDLINRNKNWVNAVQQLVESKLTFEQLRICPINKEIVINEYYEDTFIDALKKNDTIIYIRDGVEIFYDDIPQTIQWMQNVYDLSTKLKNKVEYVDWHTAKNHMEQGKKVKFKDVEYFIKNGELYWEFKSEPKITYLSLPMLDSKEWILL